MHEFPRHAKRFARFNLKTEAPNFFDRRGPLDVSIGLPPLPIPTITIGGPVPTPPPVGSALDLTPPPSPPAPAPPPVQPVQPVPSPVLPVPIPVLPIPTPVLPIPTPVLPIPTPVLPIPTPVLPVPTPVLPVPPPVQPVPTPVLPVPPPVQPAPLPVQPVPPPVQPVPPSVQPTPPPAQPAPPSVQPTPTPVQPVPTPVQPVQPVQPVPPPVQPVPNQDQGNGNGAVNNEGGDHNTSAPPNQGSGTPKPNPSVAPNPNPSSPTPNPNSPSSTVSKTLNPSSVGVVDLSQPNSQKAGSDDSGSVILTTINGVRTQVTIPPHSTSGGLGSTGGGGLVNGSGNGSGGGSGNGGNPSRKGSLGAGVIAPIVIFVVLLLALLLFFLRKQVKKRRATQHTRWLSTNEKGSRLTIRSSFGDLRASTFGHTDDECDGPDARRNSGPFSDSMAVPTTPPADHTDLLMPQVATPKLIPPAITVQSNGWRGNRISQLSVGSAESGGSDGSNAQWVYVNPDVGDRDCASPIDRLCIPSPISVRPFSPTESWFFPKPPTSRVQSFVIDRESKMSLALGPFADPIPPLPSLDFPGVVTRIFEPEAEDELAVEIGDEVSVLRMFDDGWAMVKMLRRNGSDKGVEELQGLIPIACLKSGDGRGSANLECV